MTKYFIPLMLFSSCAKSLELITILSVRPSLYNDVESKDDFNLCRKWELSKKQVKEIFLLSEKLESYDSGTIFYWLWFPFSIS